jgi:hypothetical protein
LGAISLWHEVRDVLGRADAAGLARAAESNRALVAHRAMLAAQRGRRYIEVDASDDSRPLLERLGFVAATTHDAVCLVASGHRLTNAAEPIAAEQRQWAFEFPRSIGRDLSTDWSVKDSGMHG